MLKANSVAVFSMVDRVAGLGQPGCDKSDFVGFVKVGDRKFDLDGFLTQDRESGKLFVDFRSSNSDDDVYYAGALYFCEVVDGKTKYRGYIKQSGVKHVGVDQDFRDVADDDWSLEVSASDRLDSSMGTTVIEGSCYPLGVPYDATFLPAR